MSSTLLLPPRAQLCNRSCSNKTHTHLSSVVLTPGEPTPYVCMYVSMVCGMYVGMCWVRRESTQVHREGGKVSSKGKKCSVCDHDGASSQGAGYVRGCSGSFFFSTRVPLVQQGTRWGTSAIFLFQQGTSGRVPLLQQGARWGTSAVFLFHQCTPKE
jgi:hypothetical protein